MTPPKNAIFKWLRKATPEQKKEFVKAADTSMAHLLHISSGRRGITADMAQRLAAASRTLKHRALYLDQRELCAACGVCPLVTPIKATKPKKPAKAK